jgi:hypothetical protein
MVALFLAVEEVAESKWSPVESPSVVISRYDSGMMDSTPCQSKSRDYIGLGAWDHGSVFKVFFVQDEEFRFPI